MPILTCQWKKCSRQFKSQHSTAKYCCKKHSDLGLTKYHLFQKQESRRRKGRLNKTARRYKVNKKGVYIQDSPKFQDKVIEYEHSPTGKAYIGLNKEPLMPVKKGFGFEGVLIQDDSRQFIQCHSCGEWARKLTNNHIKKCSNGEILTTKVYKKTYGLYLGQGLVSDETSLKLTEASMKNKESRIRFAQKYAGVVSSKASSKRRESHKTRQWQNAHGNCPEQLKARLREFVLINKELPRQDNRGRALYKILKKRFNTFGKGLKYYGLPHFERRGTNYFYTFPDHTIYKFNINKMYDRGALFEMMKEKCKLLQIP